MDVPPNSADFATSRDGASWLRLHAARPHDAHVVAPERSPCIEDARFLFWLLRLVFVLVRRVVGARLRRRAEHEGRLELQPEEAFAHRALAVLPGQPARHPTRETPAAPRAPRLPSNASRALRSTSRSALTSFLADDPDHGGAPHRQHDQSRSSAHSRRRQKPRSTSPHTADGNLRTVGRGHTGTFTPRPQQSGHALVSTARGGKKEATRRGCETAPRNVQSPHAG
jgi:hypothetical protein